MKTDVYLINWRSGNTEAERLGAKILIIDGYESIDPQSPLGGPDGLKDIVCEKNGWKYVAACYFGSDQKEYKRIEEKYLHDLEGVERNDADGILFITNQHITPSERQKLVKLAEDKDSTAIIYHREKLVSILDSPLGYGIRLDIFGIEMTKEEQTSFFSQQNNYLKKLLDKQSEHLISKITEQIQGLSNPLSRIEKVAKQNYEQTMNIQGFIAKQSSKRTKTKLPFPKGTKSTELIDSNQLCEIHKMLLFSEKSIELGKFRDHKVWIGNPMSPGIENATYIPPEPDKVTKLTDALLGQWRENYQAVLNGSKESKIDAIVKFHSDFLRIHPFLDGNGRVARFLLNQQANEFFNIDYKVILEDKDVYFMALNKSYTGDLELLKRTLSQAIFGIE